MKKQTAKTKTNSKRAREARAPYSTGIVIDKKALREMLEAYKEWNVEKERIRIEKESHRTPTQALEAYLDLWQFGEFLGSSHRYARQEKIESMLRYYEQIKRFEAWRRARAERP